MERCINCGLCGFYLDLLDGRGLSWREMDVPTRDGFEGLRDYTPPGQNPGTGHWPHVRCNRYLAEWRHWDAAAPSRERLQDALCKERSCDGYVEYQPGLTPTDHRTAGFTGEARGSPPAVATRYSESRSYDYAVAISFAGEERAYASSLADELRNLAIAVFYDDYEQSILWGKDLAKYLGEIYNSRSRYCVMFVSESYQRKPWPTHERRHALDRQIAQMGEDYILPIQVDDTRLSELPGTIAYQDLRRTTVQQLARLVREKLDLESCASPVPGPASISPRAVAPTAREAGLMIFNLIAVEDYEAVAELIHPAKGVTLALYAAIVAESRKLSAQQFVEALRSGTPLFFGIRDGKGDEVWLSLEDYLRDWLQTRMVWDSPQLAVSIDPPTQGHGLTPNNLLQVFPRAVVIEAFRPANQDLMDWRAVRIALEEVDSRWRIVAVVPDVWTI